MSVRVLYVLYKNRTRAISPFGLHKPVCAFCTYKTALKQFNLLSEEYSVIDCFFFYKVA